MLERSFEKWTPQEEFQVSEEIRKIRNEIGIGNITNDIELASRLLRFAQELLEEN